MKQERMKQTGLFKTIISSALLLAVTSPVYADTPLKPGKSVIGNYLAGRHAESERDLSIAADFLKAALAEAPEAPDLLRRTFVILTMEGRFEEAAVLAKDYIKDQPKSSVANLMLAVNDMQAGNHDAAENRLATLPDSGLTGLTAPVLRAWAFAGQDKTDDALKALEALDKESAIKAIYTLHKGLVLEYSGRHDEAMIILEEIAARDEGMSFRFAELIGNIYERTGEAEKAKALYQKYQNDRPGTTLFEQALMRVDAGDKPKPEIGSANDGAAEVLFGIANSLRQQRARETALVLSRLALHLKPDYPIMLTLVGELLEMDDRLVLANEFYAKVDAKSSFGRSAVMRIAANLHDMEKTDEAISLLREVAETYLNDPEPPTKIGDYLRSRERFAEAIPEYDEALRRAGELKPQHWRLLYIRGIVLEREKQWIKAEKDFLKALEFEPDQPYVLNYLGYSWVEQERNLDQALEMIQKAVKLRPNDGYIIDSLGWVYYQLNEFEKAAKELERAVEYRPEDPVINDHLGDAYWKVGRKVEARFQWKRSLSLKPDESLIETVTDKLKHGLKNDDTASPEPEKKAPDNG
jgi:tetratricopeptide (TPR) repeat protein